MIGAEDQRKPEAEVHASSAHARCTAVARRFAATTTAGRHRAAVAPSPPPSPPPDVAADTDVLATVAVDALAGGGSPHAAAALAAARAAAAAVGDVVRQARGCDAPGRAGTATVDLVLSARCVVQTSCSPRQRSAAYSRNN